MQFAWPTPSAFIIEIGSIFLKILSFAAYVIVNSSVEKATRYGLDGPCFESRWGKDFACCANWHWGSPSLLYVGHRSFLGIKLPEPGADQPHISSSDAANGSGQHLHHYSVPVAAWHGVNFRYGPWFTASPPHMKNVPQFQTAVLLSTYILKLFFTLWVHFFDNNVYFLFCYKHL